MQEVSHTSSVSISGEHSIKTKLHLKKKRNLPTTDTYYLVDRAVFLHSPLETVISFSADILTNVPIYVFKKNQTETLK